MKSTGSRTAIVCIAVLLPATAALWAKPTLQEELPGAKVYFRSGSAIKCKDISTGATSTIVSSGATGTTKISGDGKRVLSASRSVIKVFETATGQKVFEKSISCNGGNGAAAEINWDGSRVYIVSGSTIKRISIPGGTVQDVYNSREGIAREGEFCMSKDENRFVGRYSNSKAVHVDVKNNWEGSFDNECSPCISPSGTRCAVNQGGHTTMQIHTWPLSASSPSKWRLISSQVGSWDNHTWSNHDDYLIDHNGKILNVESQNSWNASINGDDYIDLWVPTGPADNQAPTAPSNLKVVSKTSTCVTLSWTAAEDNVGVTGYTLYSGSNTLGTAPGTKTEYQFCGLSPQTDYTLTLKATDGTNLSDASNSVSVTTEAMGLPLKISLGSTSSTGGFLPDAQWSTDAMYGAVDEYRALSVGDAVAGTTDDAVYQTLIAGPDGGTVEYKVKTGNGTFSVTLMFAEFWRDGAGGRTFDVRLEGNTIADSPIDIAGEVGKAAAYDVTATVEVGDGVLDIKLDNPGPSAGDEIIWSGLVVDEASSTVSPKAIGAHPRRTPAVIHLTGRTLTLTPRAAANVRIFRADGTVVVSRHTAATVKLTDLAPGAYLIEVGDRLSHVARTIVVP